VVFPGAEVGAHVINFKELPMPPYVFLTERSYTMKQPAAGGNELNNSCSCLGPGSPVFLTSKEKVSMLMESMSQAYLRRVFRSLNSVLISGGTVMQREESPVVDDTAPDILPQAITVVQG
jgi:hypothetical protein